MKFVVVGASGFIGRHILSCAVAHGYPVIGTQAHSDLRPGNFRFNLEKDRIGEHLPAFFLDTNEPIFGVISVAFPTLEAYRTQQELSQKVHVDKTIQLIQDFRSLKIRPIFLSSNYVFDGRTGYYHEGDECNPVTEYGRTKRQVEEFLSKECSSYLILRLQAVLGWNPSEKHLFSRWLDLIMNHKPIECIEGELIAPTVVNDVARAIVMAAQRGMQGVYHLAGQEFFMRDELARQFLRVLGVDARVLTKPQNEFGFLEPRPLKCYLDSGRFRNETGMIFSSMKHAMRTFKEKL